MSKYKVVLFDLDGTISNTSEGVYNSAVYALEKMHKFVPDKAILSRFIGPPLKYSFATFCNDISEEEIPTAVEYYRERYVVKGVLECKLYDGLKDVLISLKNAGLRIGVATAKPQLPAEDVLRYLGVYDLFDVISGEFDDLREDKDLIIQYAITELAAPIKSEIIMIGDRFYDIEGANKLGIDSIGVTYGFGSLEELSSAGATYLADAPSDILDIILK